MLNVDYKTLASILALRLSIIFGYYIHKDKSSLIKQRYLNNIKTVMNINDIPNMTKIPSLLLFSNAEKDFDRLEWNIMLLVLTKMDLAN